MAAAPVSLPPPSQQAQAQDARWPASPCSSHLPASPGPHWPHCHNHRGPGPCPPPARVPGFWRSSPHGRMGRERHCPFHSTGPALRALAGAPGGSGTGTAHADAPGLLCSRAFHAPRPFSPSAGRCQGQLSPTNCWLPGAASSGCAAIFTPTSQAMHVWAGRGWPCFVCHHVSSLLSTWASVLPGGVRTRRVRTAVTGLALGLFLLTPAPDQQSERGNAFLQLLNPRGIHWARVHDFLMIIYRTQPSC